MSATLPKFSDAAECVIVMPKFHVADINVGSFIIIITSMKDTDDEAKNDAQILQRHRQ
jgi:hypothetical protein